MHIKKIIICIAAAIILLTNVKAQAPVEVDICIYGGTSAGVIAAYTAKKNNKTVLLIEPGKRLGGLSSGGLGYTDIGNKYAVTGLALDFYRRMGTHYGKFEQWIFEPSVAENIFKQYIKEGNVEVLYEHRIESAVKDGGYIKSITLNHSRDKGKSMVVKAKMFLDCSYEGDLLHRVGVNYIVGRESNSDYNETYNGVQLLNKHQFPDGIDPYKVPGDPSSGLLWGISRESLDPTGTGDKKVQAYNFRICLTNQPGNMIPIEQPDNYDASRYELLLRVLEKQPAKDLRAFLKFDLMPNNKTDINNNGAFSTDMIGFNYSYPEADYTTREKIQKEHEDYVKGLLYFIGHDPRMPEHLRELMLKWGYPKDEYTDNGHWSPQMYVREARRMIGDYVMTQANCEGKEVVKDGVGMAAYTMDSHNCQRLIVNGMVKNEGDVQIGGFGPYPIAYRSLIPKAAEARNLLVPVCLSATHIAYGSIRMEPVFMVLGQSAATAASMAIDAGQSVQEVDIKKLQARLSADPLANGSLPEIIVDSDDKQGVSIKGSWKPEKGRAFGPSMLTIKEEGGQESSVRFTPEIKNAGYYNVYTYFLPGHPGASSKTMVLISEKGKTREVPVNLSDIKVQGQTSGEWIHVGKVWMEKGRKGSVTISTRGSDGVVVADAALFQPAK